MIYNAEEVAKYILDYENTKGRIVTNFRLQRLLYFIQASFISQRGKPCFLNKMLAWYAGPIVQDVYRQYRYYAEGPIYFLNKDYSIADSDKKLIAAVLDYCSKYSKVELLQKIKNQKPWQEAYNSFEEEITIEAMQKYFTKK